MTFAGITGNTSESFAKAMHHTTIQTQ